LETTLSGSDVTSQRRYYGGLRKAVPRYTIKVPKLTSKPTKSDEDRSEYARIYVGNIPYQIEDQDIGDALSKFGEVVDIIVPRWPNTRQTKGFGFVEFDKRLQANNALNSVDPIFIRGRKIILKEADKMK
jgi:ATP-dependent DNA helicase RecG